MNFRIIHLLLIGFSIILLVSGCTFPADTPNNITIEIVDGDNIQKIVLSEGTTILEALDRQGIILDPLDIISPPIGTRIDKPIRIIISRVTEFIETKEISIAFERQELPNESMVAGEVRLIQAGENGIVEQRVRHLFQDGREVSTEILSENLVRQAKTEIIMVGVLNPFQAIAISGKLAYINSGNAWLMETSTSNRKPLVTTGDLDGRIFSLSPDGKWLLFTRSSTRPSREEINNLWMINISSPDAQPINLHISNVIHFGDWRPGSEYVIAFSTVEPREAAPGWQANNDLFYLSIDPKNGDPDIPTRILENSSGGLYGWWGTSFAWSPDGTQLAFSRPDGIGLVDDQSGSLIKYIDITPLKTYSDWAWIPGMAWSVDGKSIYYTTHGIDPGFISPEDSPLFELSAYIFSLGTSISLVSDIGIFAYPIQSPKYDEGSFRESQVGFLQAIFPSQSPTSRYRIQLMDQDGSELKQLFPEEDSIGISPQKFWGAWSPKNGNPFLGILYEGNLWIIDFNSGIPQQITADGLTSRLDWK